MEKGLEEVYHIQTEKESGQGRKRSKKGAAAAAPKNGFFRFRGCGSLFSLSGEILHPHTFVRRLQQLNQNGDNLRPQPGEDVKSIQNHLSKTSFFLDYGLSL